jgi:hypothetical protein
MDLTYEARKKVIIRGEVSRQGPPMPDVLTIEAVTRGEANLYPLGAVIGFRCLINSRYRAMAEEVHASGVDEHGDIAVAAMLAWWSERQGEQYSDQFVAVTTVNEKGLVPATHHQLQKGLVVLLCKIREVQGTPIRGPFQESTMRTGLQLLENRILGLVERSERETQSTSWIRPMFR